METKKRCIDELGRVVLPISMRKELNLEQGDYLNVSIEADTILLKKAEKE